MAMPAKAQELLDTKVNLSLSNVSLENSIREIEKTSQVKFSYNSRALKLTQKVNISAHNESLSSVLSRLLTPLDISYVQVSNRIVLRRDDKKAISQSEGSSIHENQLIDELNIKGTVADAKGEKLPGVNVAVKGSTRGTSTNSNGEFTIAVPDNKSVLVFSFVGYKSQEVLVGNNSILKLVLIEDNKALEEVVVVGYGTVKKSDITGSVSSLKTQEINAFPVQNAMQSLNGRATGVHVVQNSGAPGGALSVKIRGGNSLQGSNEPLYVVDGFPLTGNINALNPADIESMEILKDASATAIYGSRGANGVVMITTKSGKSGKGRIDFETYYSTQQVIKKLELLNATEFAT
jgi:TonB-dependent SusC/RagA subfamily outer membrane receptor